MTGDTRSGDEAALEKLAIELGSLGFQCRLVNPAPDLPWLEVTYPRAVVLSERIVAQDGWYWWPWAERMVETGDVTRAAERVARVLRGHGEGSVSGC
jgi:hypothetical protein